MGKVPSFGKSSDFKLESSHLLHNFFDKYNSHYIISHNAKKAAEQCTSILFHISNLSLLQHGYIYRVQGLSIQNGLLAHRKCRIRIN